MPVARECSIKGFENERADAKNAKYIATRVNLVAYSRRAIKIEFVA